MPINPISRLQEVPTNTFVNMVHQTNDSPYSTINQPPMTTHLAINVCGALRCKCLCNNDMDAKKDNCDPDVFAISDQFSWKQ